MEDRDIGVVDDLAFLFDREDEEREFLVPVTMMVSVSAKSAEEALDEARSIVSSLVESGRLPTARWNVGIDAEPAPWN